MLTLLCQHYAGIKNHLLCPKQCQHIVLVSRVGVVALTCFMQFLTFVVRKYLLPVNSIMDILHVKIVQAY